MRILRAKQPKYFVFENVDNLLRMQNKDGSSVIDTILWHLDDAGYDVRHAVLDAKDYGVAQHRERVYFVGTRKDLGMQYVFPPPVEGTPAIEDVLEPLVDEKYLIRNEWSTLVLRGRRTEGAIKQNHPFAAGHPRHEAVQWLYDQFAQPQGRTGRTTLAAVIYGDTPSGKARRTDKVYSSKGICPTIISFSSPAVDSPQGLRMLTPRECARLQGFPDSYRLPKRDATAYKQVGNAVCVPVVAAVVKALLGAPCKTGGVAVELEGTQQLKTGNGDNDGQNIKEDVGGKAFGGGGEGQRDAQGSPLGSGSQGVEDTPRDGVITIP